MMIKITTACDMNCSHCMNNAQSTGAYMDMETFKKAMCFQEKYCGPLVIITGGEPTKNNLFEEMVVYSITQTSFFPIPTHVVTTITTNGIWMENNYNFVKWTSNKNVVWQVTSVPGYYPRLIDINNKVFSLDNVTVCNKIEAIYPQGRALTNHIPWQAKASKCFNIRAVTKQIFDDLQNTHILRKIIMTLLSRGKMCTPFISPNGEIKLGESDLCPVCSHIDKSEDEIVQDILNFECHQCDFVNAQLPPKYQLLLKRGK